MLFTLKHTLYLMCTFACHDRQTGIRHANVPDVDSLSIRGYFLLFTMVLMTTRVISNSNSLLSTQQQQKHGKDRRDNWIYLEQLMYVAEIGNVCKNCNKMHREKFLRRDSTLAL